PELGTYRGQDREVQVIDELHAERGDREHVHGKVNTRYHAGRGVVVPVAAQQGDLPVGQVLHDRRMQARPGVSRVPGAQLEAPQVMPDPDEDQVALANLDLLVLFGCGQVVGGHVVSRLEPGDAAGPGHVQQHSPAGDAVGGRGDGQLSRAGVADYVGRPVVVEPAVIDDVAEGVDM